MPGFSFTTMLVDSLLFAGLMSALILASLVWKPRIWMRHVPAHIRQQIPPLTPEEKRAQRLFMLPFFGLVLVFMIVPTLNLIARAGGIVDILAVWLNAFGILWMFNLADLVLVDWLFVVALGPRWIRFAGAEGYSPSQVFGSYGHHFNGFLKGTVFAAVGALLVAVVTVLLV